MKLSRVLSVFAVIGMLALTSCGKEDCYDCTNDDTAFAPYTICEDEAGSKAALEASVASAALGGYVCIKQ